MDDGIMDNRTIRLSVMKRCPEVYFISPPVRNGGKIHWLMYAKVPPHKRPIRLQCDMPDTAIVSHRELLNTMISELADAIKNVKRGNLADAPDENYPPLSWEGQRVFDSPDIQYMDVGAPNRKPGIILP